MHNRMVLGIAVVASFALGCRNDDFLTSLRQRPQTQFVLRTVGGNPLPAEAFSSPGLTTMILADTLTLRNDGTGEHRAVQASRGDRAAVDFPGSVTIPLRYTLKGTRIDVWLGCPVGYNCTAILTDAQLLGEVTRDGIRFYRTTTLPVGPLVYEQLR